MVRVNIDSSLKTSENRLGFNRSYYKIDNFSLMQSLNISNIKDHDLQAIVTKIPEMKHYAIFTINDTLTKQWSIPTIHWSSKIV